MFQIPPNTEETEGHVGQSAALACGLRKHLGTSNPREEHAGFGKVEDNGNFGPLREFTALSTEHTVSRWEREGGEAGSGGIPKSTAPSWGLASALTEGHGHHFSCLAMLESRTHRRPWESQCRGPSVGSSGALGTAPERMQEQVPALKSYQGDSQGETP